MSVMCAKEDAKYETIGSCQAFPAAAFHRSGTATSSTVKFVIGYNACIPETRDAIDVDHDKEEGHVLYGGEGSSSNAPPPEPAASSSGTAPPVEQAADAADVKEEVKTEGE